MQLSRLHRISAIMFLAVLMLAASCTKGKFRTITILETTDVHGTILPYDFIEKKELKNSLASASTYISMARKEGNPVILLDDGDNLQGQPAVYYYNFIDTTSVHLNAAAMNYLGYDACTVGNHDIETGHSVYDRLVSEYGFPWLAANAVNKSTGKPYFKPYAIINKNGLKVAILGMITPAVPTWLPPELYSGIEFRDMLATAKLWMPVIKNEKPDIVIGLFHSGWDEKEVQSGASGEMDENGSYSVAVNVPGFDIILTGHDHKVINKKIVNTEGDTVLVLDGGSRSDKIARADVSISTRSMKGGILKKMEGKIINVADYQPDNEFVKEFSTQDKAVRKYVNKVIAKSERTISTRDSYFGSSPFVDMIHRTQLKITHADVSFASPLSFDVRISKGPVTVGDMFKLYRFENQLYTLSLTGKEIRDYLEFSYAGWFNTMSGPDDLMLKLKLDESGKPLIVKGEAWFRNPPYDFDSAAGIDYTVDVSRPEGERVRIISFSDGRPFLPESFYKVAVNSHRGSGGGGHLITGAHIQATDLPKRLIASTERDLRYYIMKDLEEEGTIRPQPLNNWQVIPEKWVKSASVREYKLLFGNKEK